MSPIFNASMRVRVVPRLFAAVILGASPVLAVPIITVPPQRLAVVAGQPAVFSVAATDASALSYQ